MTTPECAFVLDVLRKNPSKFVRHFQACVRQKTSIAQGDADGSLSSQRER